MRHGMYDKKIERAMLSARAFRSDKSAILAAIPIAFTAVNCVLFSGFFSL